MQYRPMENTIDAGQFTPEEREASRIRGMIAQAQWNPQSFSRDEHMQLAQVAAAQGIPYRIPDEQGLAGAFNIGKNVLGGAIEGATFGMVSPGTAVSESEKSARTIGNLAGGVASFALPFGPGRLGMKYGGKLISKYATKWGLKGAAPIVEGGAGAAKTENALGAIGKGRAGRTPPAATPAGTPPTTTPRGARGTRQQNKTPVIRSDKIMLDKYRVPIQNAGSVDEVTTQLGKLEAEIKGLGANATAEQLKVAEQMRRAAASRINKLGGTVPKAPTTEAKVDLGAGGKETLTVRQAIKNMTKKSQLNKLRSETRVRTDLDDETRKDIYRLIEQRMKEL